MKTDYINWRKKVKRDKKYSIYYEIAYSSFIMSIALSIIFIVFKMLSSNLIWYNIGNFIAILFSLSVMIVVALIPVFIFISLFMVIKSEIEKYLEYKKYLKEVEKNESSNKV